MTIRVLNSKYIQHQSYGLCNNDILLIEVNKFVAYFNLK